MFFVEAAGSLHHSYNRKQKSLGLLCSKFMELYDRDDVDEVGLDDAARNLCVERRRVYDIVNVLESIGVLARKAKNQYSWIGFYGIPRALEIFRENALKEKSGINVEARCSQKTICSQDDQEEDAEDEKPLNHSEDWREERCQTIFSSWLGAKHKREKSLGMLTENFVKLFLASDVDTVTLDEAAKNLLGDSHEPSQTKSKVRRLYDIANVLSSLNLIEKTHHGETRKPAFRWLGLNGKQSEVTAAVPSNMNKRSFGMDVSNIEMSKRRKVMATAEKKSTKKQFQTKGYSFLRSTPVAAINKEEIDEEKRGKVASEDLTTNFHPDYRNQALHDLFGHYLQEWNKWYAEIAPVSETT